MDSRQTFSTFAKKIGRRANPLARMRHQTGKEFLMKRVLLLYPDDNVANSIEDIAAGDVFTVEENGKERQLTAGEAIPFGFKAAVKDIPAGGDIIKYKQVIGRAVIPIKAGDCVHTHNVEGARGRGDKKEGAK
jgi:altronate dehydratase small subunit